MNAQALKPLIGVEGIDRLPNGKVLVVSGIEPRSALGELFRGMVVVTWLGSVKSCDWSPLAGRKVDIWPDAGLAGRRYAAMLAAKLLSMKCAVRILDMDGLDPPAGAWTAMTEKWSAAQVKEFAAPRWKDITEPPPLPKGPIGIVGPPPDEAPPPVEDAPKGEPAASLVQRYSLIEQNGSPVSNAANAYAALKGMNADEKLGIAYDEFLRKIVWKPQAPVPLEDNDIVVLQGTLQSRVKLLKVTLSDVRGAVTRVARETIVNEAKDWIKALVWDGTERLPHLMSDAFGSEQNEYTAAVGRCFVMSMVARILEPGCQQDYVLVLEGKQGERKTSALGVIGGKWFSEVHEDFGSYEFLVAIQGKVLVGIGELAAFKGAKLERVKGIITRRVDTFRSKYGVWANDHPRIASFVGDTNESNYLNDPTGGRRYWPVRVHDVNLGWLRDHREQLWAEAFHRLAQGEPYWDVPDAAAIEAQESRREINPWEDKLTLYLDRQTVTEITMTDCLNHLGIAPRDELSAAKVVAPILRRLGWKRARKWDGRSRTYVYRSPNYQAQGELST